jgi:hypothetical protein
MFNTLISWTSAETETLTPAIVKASIELAERTFMTHNHWGYNKDWWNHVLTTHENIAKLMKTNETMLPRNMKNWTKKYTSAIVMATRLATLRKVGQQWDNEKIRQNSNDRKLTINEKVVFNTIMETLNERILNQAKAINLHNIKKLQYPNDLNINVFTF